MTEKNILLEPPPEFHEQEEAVNFLEYWRTLTKHKWSIFGLAMVAGVLTALVVYSMRPVYQGTATLLMEFGKSKIVSIEEIYSGINPNREYLQTQIEILKSREVAKKVVDRLKLTQHPEFNPTQQKKDGPTLDWRNWIPASWLAEKGQAAAPPEEAIYNAALGALMAHLQVSVARGSQLITISFESYDRELAAKVPNALAEVYIESDMEAKVQMTQKASGWLTERMGGLREKLEASERDLQQYRERERIVDAKSVSQGGAGQQLEGFMGGLIAARQHRAEAETSYNQVQNAIKSGTSLETIPAIIRNGTVLRSKEVEAEAQRKVAELSQRYGKEHPRMIAAEADLRAARDSLKRQADVAAATITKEYEVAKANEQALERAFGQAKADIQNINRKEFQLGVLEREVDSNRQLYDMFLARFKETNVAGDLQGTIARVIDPALPPGSPVKPQKVRAISIATLFGLVIGVLLALLLERLDNTFKSSTEVEEKLGLPVLGIIQRIKLTKDFVPQRAFLDDTSSVFSEAIRTIRTGVMLSGLDDPHKVIMVTSSVPEEGKTTVAMNLAFALGHLKRVLLIDADMRRPTIGKQLGQDPSELGLSNFVSGNAPLSKCMFQVPGTNVHVMPSGIVPPNPLELLWSKRFSDVLNTLGETFDYVVIDSPPVQLVSDASVLSRHANEVIYVVRADDTPYQVARNGIKRLRTSGGHVMGVVLNQMNIEKAERYYGEYGGYKKGYGHYGYQQNDSKRLATS